MFEVPIDVNEPMGMETMVHFMIKRTAICGRVNPGAGAQAGQPMKLVADLVNMHLIDNQSEKVL